MSATVPSGLRPATAEAESPRPSVGALRAGQQIESLFACTRKERLVARNGSTYLSLELRDRTGSVRARAFRDADFLAGQFERGDAVLVSGRVERFRGELQIELSSIERAGEQADAFQFLPAAYRDVDELDGFLEHLAGEVYDPDLRRLTDSLLSDEEVRSAWRTAPCTKTAHHAYLGGLLEHTVSVGTMAQEVAQLHPRLNSDLLLCAALVHDIGKTREFTYGAEIGFTEAGRLLGHLVLGQRIVAQRIAQLQGFPPAKEAALLHCVLCHHGPEAAPFRRFGLPEALALYRLNALDASVKDALEHGLDRR